VSRKCENELNLKNCDLINPKRQKIFEKFDENDFEFNSFDSTPTTEVGVKLSKIRFVRNSFDLIICNLIDSKGEK